MLHKFEWRKPDGRVWIEYSRQPYPDDYRLTGPVVERPESWTPPHLRWHAMRGEFVSISASRQDRPFLPPREYCPLCAPSAGDDGVIVPSEVPFGGQRYSWAIFENMFPGLSAGKAAGSERNSPGAARCAVTGRCEVVLYSPRHDSTLAYESLSHIEGLIAVWQDRCLALEKEEGLAYLFPFENKGTEIGVTLHHPHGQLYAFNHVPPFVANEHRIAASHHAHTGECLVCTLAGEEERSGERLVILTNTMVAFVPYAARYPYEVHITSRRHRPLIHQLDEVERRELAIVLKTVLLKYDRLFNFPMPYIMVHHQAAARDGQCPSYHWHIELYPPYRSAEKLKYLAGVESGTGLFINDTFPEEKAAELRAIEVSVGVFDDEGHESSEGDSYADTAIQ
jgi:UDPglucose--hexose-1-phosphate uridylyltransferase